MAQEPKKKRTRNAKARKICLLSETEIVGNLTFAKNSDEAMDMIDAAQKAGKNLFFKRIVMPAPQPKTPVTA
jgi:hypothetical protein